MWRWIHPEKQRYYQADLVLDLFGEWSLVWAWGGLGSKRGRLRSTGISSYEEGIQKIEALDVQRKKRGYTPVSPDAP